MVAKSAPLTKAQWIQRYGGQELLDSEGFIVVPCDPKVCNDGICHGWKVMPFASAERDRWPTATKPPWIEPIR